jgi:SpoVK/Ycf46/Vps4 family AAA+-type ATPase
VFSLHSAHANLTFNRYATLLYTLYYSAKENSPAIIFIDEIDAIGTKRFDSQTGADREVQRILLELLNQMDGFDQTTNVKVRSATVACHVTPLRVAFIVDSCFVVQVKWRQTVTTPSIPFLLRPGRTSISTTHSISFLPFFVPFVLSSFLTLTR